MRTRLHKILLLFVGATFGILFPLARLSMMGWMAFWGLASIGMFGSAQLVLLLAGINANFNQSDTRTRLMMWTTVLLFPIVFLFQFDFGDSSDTYYVYDNFFSINNSWIEYNGIFLSILAGILYAGIFLLLLLKRFPKNWYNR